MIVMYNKSAECLKMTTNLMFFELVRVVCQSKIKATY